MKGKYLLLSGVLAASTLSLSAQTTFVNLTPRPVSCSTKTGTFTLPSSFTINVEGLPDDMVTEVKNFADAVSDVTGAAITVSDQAVHAAITVKYLTSYKDEGYKLTVNADSVVVSAHAAIGLYYGLQSIKKLLPANVMAGVKDASVESYTLPLVTIIDQPRFSYRGFMLDVSRHFFTVEEVKRMINIMSFYKLNRFHWHLSDDQGWRVEIKKYPKLTTVGAVAPNSRFTSMTEGQYWINKPYGPYYYTQDEIRDVVAYAAARHIEIIPEIDMPGHFSAAMAAYPEYSCTPTGSHSVQTDGGIYTDILNVANPGALQFAKDILSELMDLFPGEYIHIGGDECPTTAWESNSECQAAYAANGYTSYRQLQTQFIKELSDYVTARGRKLAIWNEGITATGTDTDIMKTTGAMVYCWTSPEAAATTAAGLGLSRIYTPWGPYYINRTQSASQYEPAGAGTGTDHVKTTYNTTPPTNIDAGVQGTFWTEHVSDREYMEYLALPRLLAIAESGWTLSGRKNFEDFQKRMTADTTLLNYGGYRYCTYYMVDKATEPEAPATADVTVTTPLEDGHCYRFTNAVDGFNATALVDNGVSTSLRHSTDAAANNAWVVSESTMNSDGTQSFTLKNAVTGRYIAAGSSYVARQGRAANVGTTAATVTLKHDFADDEYRLTVGDASLFAIPAGSFSYSSTVSSGSTTSATADAARLQGATWNIEEVRVATLRCMDTAGNELATVRRTVCLDDLTSGDCPTFKGYRFVSATADADAADTYTVTFERVAYIVTLESRDAHGALIDATEDEVNIGESYTVNLPQHKYYTLTGADRQEGETFTPDANLTLTATYTTDAYSGVKAVGDVVTTLEGNHSYLLYDAVSGSNADRAGYRRIVPSTNAVNRVTSEDDLDPTAVWTLEGSGKTFKVKNEYLGLYVPQLVQSTATTASTTGSNFTFTLNADGDTWSVLGTNGQYWDGLASGALVGWPNGNGHPIRVYNYTVQPYYTVTLRSELEDGTVLATTTELVKAGDTYSLIYPSYSNYVLQSTSVSDAYVDGAVEGFVTATAVYADIASGLHAVTTEAPVAGGLYDLQGRRLQGISGPGIYIRDGRKIIVR